MLFALVSFAAGRVFFCRDGHLPTWNGKKNFVQWRLNQKKNRDKIK